MIRIVLKFFRKADTNDLKKCATTIRVVKFVIEFIIIDTFQDMYYAPMSDLRSI